jgi:hypothetical protein
MTGKYGSAYKRFSMHKFKDICLGQEREFELKVAGSIKIGEHKLAIAYECGQNANHGTFKYIIVDDYIHSCSIDGPSLRNEFISIVNQYKTGDGHKFKKINAEFFQKRSASIIGDVIRKKGLKVYLGSYF